VLWMNVVKKSIQRFQRSINLSLSPFSTLFFYFGSHQPSKHVSSSNNKQEYQNIKFTLKLLLHNFNLKNNVANIPTKKIFPKFKSYLRYNLCCQWYAFTELMLMYKPLIQKGFCKHESNISPFANSHWLKDGKTYSLQKNVGNSGNKVKYIIFMGFFESKSLQGFRFSFHFLKLKSVIIKFSNLIRF